MNTATDRRNPPTIPDLTVYRAMHEAMRESDELLVRAVTADGQNQRRRKALAKWFARYAGELRAHHHVEDHIFFPALAARVPTYASFATALADDHERLDEVLSELDTALRWLVSAEHPELRVRVARLATELRDLLLRHLAFEDDDVLSLIERHFTAAEWRELDRRARRAISLEQFTFLVPWFMDLASERAAATALEEAPALGILWRLTRRRYARLASVALGARRPAAVGLMHTTSVPSGTAGDPTDTRSEP